MTDQEKQPPLEGFYSHIPLTGPDEKKIHLFEIISGLTAVTRQLSDTIDTAEMERNEGLANAARVLTQLLRQCWHGGEVILKPRRTRAPGPPKPRKAKPAPTGNVVALLRPPAA